MRFLRTDALKFFDAQPFRRSMVGLRSALHAAERGVAAAHDRAASAAQEVARASSFELAPDTVDISSAASSERPDVARGLVDLRVARYQQAASLAVVKTVDEMSSELLRL